MFKIGDTVRRKREFLNDSFQHVCKEAQLNPDLYVYTVSLVLPGAGAIALKESGVPEFTWADYRWELYDMTIEANE